MRLSIIVPVLNEAQTIVKQLRQLSEQFAQSLEAKVVEIIVVDGGSSDNTAELARPLVSLLLSSKAGRALQMNAGAQKAKGQYLLFLHADTELPDGLLALLSDKALSQWGFFRVKLSGKHWLFRVIESGINWRTSISHSAGGDQAITVSKTIFFENDGFTSMALMEDIELCNRLKKISKPFIIKQAVITSSRRWQENGIAKTVLLMWALRLAYYCGVSPLKLKEFYANHR